jgi:hypothetical protein
LLYFKKVVGVFVRFRAACPQASPQAEGPPALGSLNDAAVETHKVPPFPLG